MLDGTFGQRDAGLYRLPGLLASHGRSLSHILRALSDAEIQQARDGGCFLRRDSDAEVGDDELGVTVFRQGIRSGSLRDEVVARHVECRILRIGRYALCCYAVVGTADDRTRRRQVRMELAGQPYVAVKDIAEPTEGFFITFHDRSQTLVHVISRSRSRDDAV